MRPHRRLMDPSTLEKLLMLRLNKDIWSEKTVQDIFRSEKTVQDIIDDKRAANRKRGRVQQCTPNVSLALTSLDPRWGRIIRAIVVWSLTAALQY